GITGPGSVGQGDTAHVVVTVQNVGGQDVPTNFDVVLTDGWAGTTVATQTIAGLAVGASVTRTLDWNTAGAAITGHTLFATQKLADANSANNSIGIGIDVTAPASPPPPPPTDPAVTGATGPARVSQGDIVPVVVTVQNVGGQDVTTSFDVVLTDGTYGNAVLGTQTISGLAVGVSATRTFNWNTAGA